MNGWIEGTEGRMNGQKKSPNRISEKKIAGQENSRTRKMKE